MNREECEKVLKVFITYNYDKRVLIKREYITELKRIRKELNLFNLYGIILLNSITIIKNLQEINGLKKKSFIIQFTPVLNMVNILY